MIDKELKKTLLHLWIYISNIAGWSCLAYIIWLTTLLGHDNTKFSFNIYGEHLLELILITIFFLISIISFIYYFISVIKE